MLHNFFEDISFGPPSNHHMRVSSVEFYQTGLCVVLKILVKGRFLSSRALSRAWQSTKLAFSVSQSWTFLALRQISTPVFYPWHSVQLDCASVGDSRPCHFSIFPCVFARLACATLVNSLLESLSTQDGVFKNDSFGPRSDLHTCVLRIKFYQIEE